ncbi:hypothetical protein DQ354_19390 [Arthrobacter sp. AQ5-06]|nr:hypothetical protein DQ354_19390 [Arthrobacter sp. AQ5-06]
MHPDGVGDPQLRPGVWDFLAGIRNLGYSVGFPLPGSVEKVLPLIPENAWTRAYNSDGLERDGAWVADVTGMLELSAWPKGRGSLPTEEISLPRVLVNLLSQ